MKKMFALFALLLILTLPVFGQDDSTAEPTDAPALETEQVIATVTPSDFVTPTGSPEPEETAVVIDINVDVTDSTDGEGSTETPSPSTGMNPDLVFMGLVLVLLVYGMADKFSNYRLSKELAQAIPADWKPVIEQGANTARRIVYERAGAFADSTEGTFDNNLLDEDMKRAGWEFYVVDGVRHARKIVAPAG